MRASKRSRIQPGKGETGLPGSGQRPGGRVRVLNDGTSVGLAESAGKREWAGPSTTGVTPAPLLASLAGVQDLLCIFRAGGPGPAVHI